MSGHPGPVEARPAADARGRGYRPFPNLAHRNFLQRALEVPAMVRALSLPRGRRVLEVGCGRGVALPVLERMLVPRVLVGLDIERSFLDEGARGQDVSLTSWVQGDLLRLPFADRSFDVVVDFGTCYHVGDPGAAVAEVARVLAPGGVFATETKLAQLLAHPLRTRGRRLGLERAGRFVRRRHAGMWASWKRSG